ncbi:MAG: response regulator transcription factor [Armatimonadetes bacterium]|nr:response regulator transcription factor [Armatimonadota bacterium]
MDKKPYRILIVDNEKDLVWALERSLKEEGYEVLKAYSGVQALAKIGRHDFDVIILDVVMPGMDGFQVCRRLRKMNVNVPILFLTMRAAIADRIHGLDRGGDDYLGKPFDMKELKARIRALIRRHERKLEEEVGSERPGSILQVGNLTLVMETREVKVGDATVKLTSKEFELFHYLTLHVGEVFSSDELLQQVWGYPPDSKCTSLVRWHIKSLREKISPDPSQPLYLRTMPRQGYVLLPNQ